MRIFLGLVAASLYAAGCLLATSLDGLEGPPQSGASGASGAGGTDIADAEARDGPSDGDGSSPDVFAAGPVLFRDRKNGGSPRGITLSRDGVYWAEAAPNVGILYAPKVGATTPVHLEAQSDLVRDVFDVGVDDVSLYWTEYSANVVRSRPLLGGNSAANYFTGAGHAAYLAMADNGHLLLTDYNTTIAAVVYGPTSIAVANDQKPPASGIAYCSSVVYWAYGQPSYIATSDPMGNARNNRYYTPPDAVTITGLACDDTNLYWIANNRSIQWIDLVEKLANPPLYTADVAFESGDNVGDIAVDADWIYFTEPQTRAISKLAKPPARDR